MINDKLSRKKININIKCCNKQTKMYIDIYMLLENINVIHKKESKILIIIAFIIHHSANSFNTDNVKFLSYALLY